MVRLAKMIVGLLFIIICICSVVWAQIVITEKELKDKISAKRILHIYLTDFGITGFELNQYGAPANEFLVPGPYDKMPADIFTLAEANKIQVLPSQQTPKVNTLTALAPAAFWAFIILLPMLIWVWMIRINKKLTKIIDLLKK